MTFQAYECDKEQTMNNFYTFLNLIFVLGKKPSPISLYLYASSGASYA